MTAKNPKKIQCFDCMELISKTNQKHKDDCNNKLSFRQMKKEVVNEYNMIMRGGYEY